MAAFASNAYVNSSGSFAYINTNTASYYQQLNGQHQWYNAPSGTAGNTISFTQAMTLGSNGNLSIGNTNTDALVSGTERVLRVSGSNLASLYLESIGNRTWANYVNSAGTLTWYDITGAATRLTIASTGAATFSNALQVAGQQAAANYGGTGLNFDFTSGNIGRIASVKNTSGGSQLQFLVYNTSGTDVNALQIASTGAATFSSSVTASYYDGAIFRVFTSSTFRGGVGTASWAFGDGSNNIALTSEAATLIGAGGFERMRITSGGNVGIGTTSPIDKLHIVGGITSTSLAVPSNMGIGSLQIGYDGTNGIIRTWASSPLIISTYNYQAFETSGSERMRITSGGNVGIGTSSPTGLLDLGAASNGNALTWSLYSNLFSEYSSGALWMSSNFFANVGSSGFKTSLTATFGAAGIKVSGTSGSGNSGLIQFYVDEAVSKTANAAFTPTERMRITSGGNVGIGTISPTLLLDVEGQNQQFGSSTAFRTARFTSKSSAVVDKPGVILGYDTSGGGVIAAATETSGQPLNFWTYNGSSWGERMRITSGGLVGIGTTSPLSLLNVQAASNTNLSLTYTTNSGANYSQISGGSINLTNKWATIQFRQDASEDAHHILFSTANPSTNTTERMRITSGGSVLIGTTTEGFLGKLQVAGSVAITGQYNTVLPSSSFSYFDGSGQVVSSASSASALYLDTTWNTTGNPDGIYLNVTNTASGSSSKLLNLKVGNASQFSVSKGGAIQTSDPTNGTARPWKLGDARSGSISTDSYIIVSVNGVTYSIPALNGLP